MVKRESKSKEMLKQKIVHFLRRRKKATWSVLKNQFTPSAKQQFKICKRTMDNYLKELIKEEVIEHSNGYYMLTEFGEEYWWRYTVSEKIKEEANMTNAQHLLIFHDFLKTQDILGPARFWSLFHLFKDLVEHEDLFNELDGLRAGYNLSKLSIQENILTKEDLANYPQFAHLEGMLIQSRKGAISSSWHEFLFHLLESKK